LGACFYRLCPSFSCIQLYHLLFSAQLLIFFLLLVKDWSGERKRVVPIAVLALATLPMFTLFGILMYVDIPMAAQVVTAFFFLNRRKYLPAILFMVLALLIKENAFLLLPPFFLLLLWRADWKKRRYPILWSVAAAVIFAVTILVIDYFTVKYTTLHEHNELAHTFRSAWSELSRRVGWNAPPVAATTVAAPASVPAATPPEGAAVAANHLVFYYPGDLRLVKNWFIFMGAFLVMMVLGGLGLLVNLKRLWRQRPPEAGPLAMAGLVVICYVIPASYMLWHNPDIRYFFPCIPFLIFIFAVGCDYFKYAKGFFIALAAVMLLQAGMVMAKIHQLRSFDPDFRQIIAVMKNLKTDDNKNAKVFMYADKWRYMPLEPYWDITRKVWALDINGKYRMFRDKDIWFVVVDKSKIADQFDHDSPSRYAENFVAELDNVPQLFRKLSENRQFIIYRVLAPPPTP
ncbi:MAG: hypothetical protein PHQ27_09585, partial [Victivallales bacterium]|nr:hypothetical protein [Victivallales bacterium]